jgi:hypothetical protein
MAVRGLGVRVGDVRSGFRKGSAPRSAKTNFLERVLSEKKSGSFQVAPHVNQETHTLAVHILLWVCVISIQRERPTWKNLKWTSQQSVFPQQEASDVRAERPLNEVVCSQRAII